MKILDNAVISKCGECKTMFTSDGRSLDKWHCPFGKFRPVNPDTMDKDCPLLECEVIKCDSAVIEWDTADNFGYPEYNNIDRIIIVKKPGR